MASVALQGQQVAERAARLVVVDASGERTLVSLAEGRKCGVCGAMAMLMINRGGRTRCGKCDAEVESRSAVVGLMAVPSPAYSRQLLVQVDSDEPTTVLESDFAGDNEDDLHLVEDVSALKTGESGTFGGGAAPVVKVTVLS